MRLNVYAQNEEIERKASSSWCRYLTSCRCLCLLAIVLVTAFASLSSYYSTVEAQRRLAAKLSKQVIDARLYSSASKLACQPARELFY
jgi:hypothetical protein